MFNSFFIAHRRGSCGTIKKDKILMHSKKRLFGMIVDHEEIKNKLRPYDGCKIDAEV